jgi:hypothetical protein
VKLLNLSCDATHTEPGSVAPKSCHIEPSKFKTNVTKITDKETTLTSICRQPFTCWWPDSVPAET